VPQTNPLQLVSFRALTDAYFCVIVFSDKVSPKRWKPPAFFFHPATTSV
jgi:hypothetical protein